jgi:hypothetical protein
MKYLAKLLPFIILIAVASLYLWLACKIDTMCWSV